MGSGGLRDRTLQDRHGFRASSSLGPWVAGRGCRRFRRTRVMLHLRHPRPATRICGDGSLKRQEPRLSPRSSHLVGLRSIRVFTRRQFGEHNFAELPPRASFMRLAICVQANACIEPEKQDRAKEGSRRERGTVRSKPRRPSRHHDGDFGDPVALNAPRNRRGSELMAPRIQYLRNRAAFGGMVPAESRPRENPTASKPHRP